MHIPNNDFHHLTKNTLNDQVGHTFSTNRPHAPCRIGARQILARQASSIRYPAAHAHFLRVFKLIPHLGKYASLSNRRERSLDSSITRAERPVILALAELAAKCKTLEEIVIRPVAIWEEQVIGGMKDAPWYVCGDAVFEEAEGIFRLMTSSIWM
jgi:hypothetical protein